VECGEVKDMSYLIDANNLAYALFQGRRDGKLEKDFDQKLIKILKKFIEQTGKKITLVFEGIDSMGDKRSEGNLTIIQAPRDNYYQSADDKIIELINNETKPGQLVVISDDREIMRAAEQAGCQIKQASYFAKILKDKNLCRF